MPQQTPLQRILVISVFAMICFAGGILTYAVGYFFPTGLTIPLAILALIFNEHLKLFRINLMTANVLGILSFIVAGFQFFSDDPEGRLLSGINLLCYVQWILLFLDKNEEQYWWHIALSVLQVAASAVLTFFAWYGIVLALFIPVMVWTLAVYIMFLSDQQFRKSQGLDLALAAEDVSGTSVVTPQGRWRQADNFSRSTVLAFEGLRESRSAVSNSIRLNSRKAWITPRFIFGTAMLSFLACLLGGVIFLCVPRVWIEGASSFQEVVDNRASGAGRQKLSGFTQEIKLGDVGEILQNPQVVFRVKLTDRATGQTMSVYEYARRLQLDEPLFRGAVLTTYESGRWRPLPPNYGGYERVYAFNNRPADQGGRNFEGRRNGDPGSGPRRGGPGFRGGPPAPVVERLIQHEYRLEPIGVPTMFTLGPIRNSSSKNRDLGLEAHSETFDLRYDFREGPRGVQYELFSLDRLPDDTIPDQASGFVIQMGGIKEFRQQQDHRKEFLRFDRSAFPNLIKLAEEVKAMTLSPAGQVRPNQEGAMAQNTDVVVANAFVNYLSRPDKFTYALNVPVVDSSIDPVEDFIVNRKRGHCEYFASALALMLRAVNIPSRIINGFKGGTEKADKSLEVQQRYAHSWVEAYVAGRWRIFDPTPTAARSEILEESKPDLAKQIRNALMENWIAYVVNLTSDRQWELVQPMWQSIQKSFSEFDLRDWPTEILAWIYIVISEPRRIFSWLGGVIFLGAALVGWFLWLIVRRLLAFYRRNFRGKEGVGFSIQSGILFFSNFLKLMARRGIKPVPAQTPGEFVDSALTKIEGLSNGSLELGSRISQAFYQVRFGHEPLSEIQEKELAQGIERLREDLTHHHGRNGHGKLSQPV